MKKIFLSSILAFVLSVSLVQMAQARAFIGIDAGYDSAYPKLDNGMAKESYQNFAKYGVDGWNVGLNLGGEWFFGDSNYVGLRTFLQIGYGQGYFHGVSPKRKNMQENSKILRLIYPQWQGGDIAGWFKDMDTKSASQGYILGAQILNLLVDSIKDSKMQLESKSPQNIVTIDISRDFIESRKDTKEGIIDKEILQVQTRRTLEILNAKKPQKILTLGGECSVSIAPFSYLAHIYSGELAVIWLDAHPDIGLPHDTFYQGYHAMAVSALLGKRNKNARFDLQKDFGLPTIIESSKILLAGLNSNEATHFAERVKDFGLSALSAKDVSQDSNKVLSWLKKSGVKKVAIHLDLDVLDAKELYVAVGNTGALSTTQVARLINDVASEYEIVALTIAEHFPKVEIMLRNFLAKLPLIK